MVKSPSVCEKRKGHRSRRADRAPGRCRAGGGLLGGKDPTGRLSLLTAVCCHRATVGRNGLTYGFFDGARLAASSSATSFLKSARSRSASRSLFFFTCSTSL